MRVASANSARGRDADTLSSVRKTLAQCDSMQGARVVASRVQRRCNGEHQPGAHEPLTERIYTLKHRSGTESAAAQSCKLACCAFFVGDRPFAVSTDVRRQARLLAVIHMGYKLARAVDQRWQIAWQRGDKRKIETHRVFETRLRCCVTSKPRGTLPVGPVNYRQRHGTGKHRNRIAPHDKRNNGCSESRPDGH